MFLAALWSHKLHNSSIYLGTCKKHETILAKPNLIIVQQDATYSVYYISVGSSTCFGCWHPSSGARSTVITASVIP